MLFHSFFDFIWILSAEKGQGWLNLNEPVTDLIFSSK